MDRPIIPTFSRQEMERRWFTVRAEMRKPNLGDTVVIERSGARRLGKRALKFLSLERG